MPGIFSKTEGFILDMIFPRSCIRCGSGGFFVCDQCIKDLQPLSFQMCPVCERAITVAGEKCDLCRRTSSHQLDKLIVAGSYDDSFLAQLIHTYKYKFVEELSGPLGNFLLNSLKKWAFPVPDLIIPVPLHKRRLKWRGFNQAFLLAQHLSKNIVPGLEIPLADDVLLRKRYTAPQMKIKKRHLRAENINKAFVIDNKKMEKCRSANILLVDDVCTTGATIFECCRLLGTAKPRTITAAVLARQSI